MPEGSRCSSPTINPAFMTVIMLNPFFESERIVVLSTHRKIYGNMADVAAELLSFKIDEGKSSHRCDSAGGKEHRHKCGEVML